MLTATALDRETIDTYLLVIEANDRGTPSLTGTGNLTIEVMDINDNRPHFVGSPEATIVENALAESLVTSNLTAIDSDLGSNADLTWQIVSGNVFDTFRIVETTGDIIVRNTTELDYETTPVFFLELLVHDAGQPQLSSSLLVREVIIMQRGCPLFSDSSVLAVHSFRFIKLIFHSSVTSQSVGC